MSRRGEEMIGVKTEILFSQRNKVLSLEGDQAGREAALEWNTSQISASTSVFDISESLPEESNYSIISEMSFGGPAIGSSNQNHSYISGKNEESVSSRTVPSDDSMVADAVASFECNDSLTLNSSRILKEKKKSYKTPKKKKSYAGASELGLSLSSGSSEDSINYSAIQSAVLLAKDGKVCHSHDEANMRSSFNNNIQNDMGKVNQMMTDSLYITGSEPSQINNGAIITKEFQKSETINNENNVSSASESQLNSTYITSGHSSDISLNQSNLYNASELEQVNTTSVENSTFRNNRSTIFNMPPILEESEPKTKQQKKPEGEKTINNKTKKATRAEVKTKTKGTQANIKTKANKVVNKNVKRKPRTLKDNKQGDLQSRNNGNEQKAVDDLALPVETNNLPENINLNMTAINSLDPTIVKLPKEKLLEERLARFLEMPGTSQQDPVLIHNLESSAETSVISNQSVIEANAIGMENAHSKCSVQIVRDTNNTQKISIVLPPETVVSVSKNDAGISHTMPVPETIIIKEEKLSPESQKNKDLKSNVIQKKMRKEKEAPKKGTKTKNNGQDQRKETNSKAKRNDTKNKTQRNDKNRKAKRSDTNGKAKRSDKNGKAKRSEANSKAKRNGKRSPEPPKNRHRRRTACDYMSSESSDDSGESSCGCNCSSDPSSDSCSCSDCGSCSDDSSYSCSCSDCGSSCSCSCSYCDGSSSRSYCDGTSSCTCSDCYSTDSSYSPCHRRGSRR